MPDECDVAQDNAANYNADAIAEHERKMADMEMVAGEYACEDCGKILHSLTKARANSPVILCGECADWHKQRNKLGKMREGYL